MEVSGEDPKNPLGLSLDFLFGRGYLWAQRQRLSDWIALENLRMEIPDLQFPFDARGGLDRFRHTRCLVREVEFAISEVGLGDLLTEAASHLQGFEELQVRFLEDSAHISLKLSAFGADTYLSFRAALIPPEPARADEVHLSLYDYRAFGPLPYPARLVAHELLTSLLNTPVLRASGRGPSFTVGIAGDIVSLRPLKLLFLHIFPAVGWKLPNLAGVVLAGARIRPGVLTVRAVDAEPRAGATGPGREYHLATSPEGGRALAAYEAKELFAHADQALFEGQVRQAISLLASYRDVYGLHPELVARLLDCLLADPTPGNLAEAEAIRRELLAQDPEDLQAHLVGPLLALASYREDEALKAFEELSAVLERRRQTRDWILCELALAARLGAENPGEASRRLREVLKVDPRNQAALEALRRFYERTGEQAGLEETLKRLTGVYTDRQTLKSTYLQLARHLMDRQGDLGEARIYLEKVLRLDPGELDALHTLGESYLLSGEPLRALKAFGSAARAAEGEGFYALASRLQTQVGEIWFKELENAQQGLLFFRRALALRQEALKEDRDALSLMEQVNQLRWAARMCEELGSDEEAASYWNEAIPLLERAGERSEDEDDQWSEELVDAHIRLAAIYDRRERWAAAASHQRRVLELRPDNEGAQRWLEEYLRQAGQPEELIELYRDLLGRTPSAAKQVELLLKLADLYIGLGLVEEAQIQLREALDREPGRRDLRQKLVELLREHGRFETLREALKSLLVRVREREDRWEIAIELGQANAELGELDQAVRSYLEAIKLLPARLEGLEGACRVLEQIVDERGALAMAPAGTERAGKLLENLLIRLAEVAPTRAQERDALLKVAHLAEERGDRAAAAEARDRATVLADTATGAGEGFGGVDARLDSMLEEFIDISMSEFTAELGEPEPAEPEPSELEPSELEPGNFEFGSPDTAKIEALGEEETSEPDEIGALEPVGDEEELDFFRSRFESMLKKPAPLPRPGELPSGSAMSRILNRSYPEEPETRLLPAPLFSDLQHLSSPGDEGTSFEDDRKETAPQINPVQIALNALGEARQDEDPEELAKAIEGVLALAGGEENDVLGEAQRNSLRRELGELYYYELEESERALPHLEALRRADPEGLGATPGVVNALESIYEELGEVQARVRLLEERLEAAQSEEMATTYRLLIAQLLWDQSEDGAGARRWLDEVLEYDREHEAAHRLLAEIAEEEEDWAEAARHLEVAVSVAGGGVDAVETQRRLARLYLEKLHDTARAQAHFEAVLEAAPGDSMALEGIKEAQLAREDWPGLVASLGRELGLLLGRPEGMSLEELRSLKASSVAVALRVPASQIVSEVAEVVEEKLGEQEGARALWGLAYQLWPEHVEALERRIKLDRACEDPAALAEDLEALAAMLLDQKARFTALIEAAELRAQKLNDPEGAQPLYTEAIALVQDDLEPPQGLDAARRALKRLQAGDTG